MSTLFDRNAITEVVLLAREGADVPEVLGQAFPNAQIRRATQREINGSSDALFAATPHPKLVVVAHTYVMLAAMYVRNGLSFAMLQALDDGGFAVNRAEAGVVTRVFPESDA